MTARVTQKLVDAGTAPTFVAATVSDTYEVGSGANSFLVIKNTSGASASFTVTVPGNTGYGVATPDPLFVVPQTTGEKWIPLRREYIDGDVAGPNRCTVSMTVGTPGSGITTAVVRL